MATQEKYKKKRSLDAGSSGEYDQSNDTGQVPADPVQTYDRQLEQIYQQYVDRQSFSYDMESDPLYRQYRQQYITQGQQAMQDTVAQAAALTGGYGSTYAETAGQQAYGRYLQQLSALAPELYTAAWERYQTEGDLLKDQYSAARDMAQTAYQRQQDEYERQKAEEQTAYDREQDAYNRQKAEEQTAYDREQDALYWQYQDEKTAYERQQDEYARQKAEEQTAYDREQDAYERQKAEEQTAYDREQDALYWQYQDEKTAYERQQDEYQRQKAEEQTAYDREQDALYWQYQDEKTAYDQAQDALDRKTAAEQLAYDRQQDANNSKAQQEKEAYQRQQDAYDNLEDLIAAGYTPTDAELSAAGMTRTQANTLRSYYASKNTQSTASGSSSSGSSSGSSGSSSTGTSHQDEWKAIGTTVSVGSPSVANIKVMQTIFGVTVDGIWGPKSTAAAGNLTAAEAWKKLNNGTTAWGTARAQKFYQDKGTRAQWKARGVTGNEYDAMVTNWLKNSGLLPAEICWLKQQFAK